MNIYVSSQIQEKYKFLEFRGKSYKWKNKTLIKARHKILDKNMIYCFEDDFAWLDGLIPENILAK